MFWCFFALSCEERGEGVRLKSKPMCIRDLYCSASIQGSKPVELFIFQPVVIVDKIEVWTGRNDPPQAIIGSQKITEVIELNIGGKEERIGEIDIGFKTKEISWKIAFCKIYIGSDILRV